MKKILTLSLLLMMGFISSSHAQLEEGSFMLGADLGSGLSSPTTNGLFGFNLGLNDGAGFDVGLSPKAGYFINDNLLLGGIVNLGYTKSPEVTGGESVHTFIYGVQGLSRFYLRPSDVELNDVVNTGRFFLETNAGVAGVNIKDGATTNGFTFGFGPGYSYFLNSNVALEASAKYSGLAGGGNTEYQNSLGIHLGIQVFIPSGDAEAAVEDLD